jgi:FtsZ-binding cell division protein ZapB
MKEYLPALAALLLVTASPAMAQTPSGMAPPAREASSGAPAPAGDEAMAWDRDFDLLLELKNEPTRGQQEMDTQRAALEQERRVLLERMDGLRSRLAAVEGTYTTEAILKEMLQQEVADMQTAQENLRNWIRQDEDRVKEIDARLQKLAVEGGK